MGTENEASKLPSEILDQARAEGEKIISLAEDQAKEIIFSARRDALDRKEAAIKGLEREKRTEKRSDLAVKKAAIRRESEEETEKLVGIAIEGAKRKLASFARTQEYSKAFLHKLSEKALEILTEKPARISCNPKDRKDLEALFKGAEISEDGSIMGGFVAENGSEVCDMTLDKALSQVEDSEGASIRRVLFS